MERVSALTAPLYEFGRSTASSAEKRTREQPLPTLAAAAAGGLLTGYLVSKLVGYALGNASGKSIIEVNKGSSKGRPRLTRIYFLRHGESTNNVRSDEAFREPDPSLTTLGHQQAANIGNYLSKLAAYYNFKHVYVSPMKKTLATAAPLTSFLKAAPSTAGIHCEAHPLLYEYGGLFDEKYGSSTGLTRKEMREMAPYVKLPEDTDAKLSFPFPGSDSEGWYAVNAKETNKNYLARVKQLASWLWSLDDASLLVTHGKLMDTVVKVLLNVPNAFESNSPCIFLHGGCAFSCVELDHETGKVGVMYLNQPIVSESRLRTGHKIAGFSLKQW
mmetsp:Transcript_24731/g.62181  ORF Transcript_24731/g.62181 Transcript_24731/m.62181 type:complete len:330 (+) Transcript_24731:83-1072(+)|eukprot:CAMPEP_0178993300 /NCGR_PEP_ID=MMETSP0795-20121207/6628_1 /TAXON_ID=88552 /ORGANISM="Amoebophrya sp., Strain Ameob2" /LENGTH=329 /DNA_ID=CAMNT_0020685347 /DNA_START=59 /DNA_END=1048 /DNA_ORIENTATION=+